MDHQATALRLLVVEDELMLLDVVTTHLEDVGYDVIPATTEEIALDILKSGDRIDILFTDIRMPGALDGSPLANAARKTRPSLPVIYATGFSHTPPRMVGGAVFFQKPYRAAAVIRAIKGFGVSPPA